jgi:hypothetical protein
LLAALEATPVKTKYGLKLKKANLKATYSACFDKILS